MLSADAISNFESFWPYFYDLIVSCETILLKKKSSSLIIDSLKILLVNRKAVYMKENLLVKFPYAVTARKGKREEVSEGNLFF